VGENGERGEGCGNNNEEGVMFISIYEYIL
jgi:hypothetical protein